MCCGNPERFVRLVRLLRAGRPSARRRAGRGRPPLSRGARAGFGRIGGRLARCLPVPWPPACAAGRDTLPPWQVDRFTFAVRHSRICAFQFRGATQWTLVRVTVVAKSERLASTRQDNAQIPCRYLAEGEKRRRRPITGFPLHFPRQFAGLQVAHCPGWQGSTCISVYCPSIAAGARRPMLVLPQQPSCSDRLLQGIRPDQAEAVHACSTFILCGAIPRRSGTEARGLRSTDSVRRHSLGKSTVV